MNTKEQRIRTQTQTTSVKGLLAKKGKSCMHTDEQANHAVCERSLCYVLMSQTEYQALIQSKALHLLVIGHGESILFVLCL